MKQLILNKQEEKFFNQLTKKVESFKKLKTIQAVNKKFEELEADNHHSFNSLLMAVHYGTPKDVETVKELIIKQARTLCPNASDTKRIKMTSKFYDLHLEQMPQKINFYVDIPNSDINVDEMINVDVFQSREEAIAFAREHFGADENGCICLIAQ